jgi:hypothetical protein
MDPVEVVLFAGVVLAALLFVIGVIVAAVRRGALGAGSRARVLPSTIFSSAAFVSILILMALIIAVRNGDGGDWGEGVAVYSVAEAIGFGTVGGVSSLAAVGTVPNWQWGVQATFSAVSLLGALTVAALFLGGVL